MTTIAGVDVATRIAGLVEQHRAELEQIVDAELDRALDAIVAERIAARNGAARVAELVSPVGDTPANQAQARELCSRCRERPRLAGRTICVRCKSRRDLERGRVREAQRQAAGVPPETASAGDDQEPPRPDVTA